MPHDEASRVRLIPLTDHRAWDRVVRSCSPHDTYHSAAYHEVASGLDGSEALMVVAEADGDIACLPFLLRDIDAERTDVISAYGYPGALASSSNPALRPAFAEAVEASFSELGAVSAFIRQHPLIDTNWLWEGFAPVETLGFTVGIDLTVGEERVRSLANENHRRNLRRTEEVHPSLSPDEGFQDLHTFISLYEKTMRRREADPAYYFPTSYYYGLVERLGERVKLFHGLVDRRIMSSVLVLDSGSIVQYHLAGSSDEALALGMPRWTLEHVRRWASSEGRSWFHLGGGLGASRDSLFTFKAGFSKTFHPFSVVKLITDRDAYRHLAQAHADTPRRTGWFPAYRAPETVVSPDEAAVGDTDPTLGGIAPNASSEPRR